ncbi:hypothetical protein HMPREF1861_00474 [Corynebacterium kroppenstedtii]|nr:hypothetical protein HMPREF1861_00474 [Corynebacterium kroppenstedtii]
MTVIRRLFPSRGVKNKVPLMSCASSFVVISRSSGSLRKKRRG